MKKTTKPKPLPKLTPRAKKKAGSITQARTPELLSSLRMKTQELNEAVGRLTLATTELSSAVDRITQAYADLAAAGGGAPAPAPPEGFTPDADVLAAIGIIDMHTATLNVAKDKINQVLPLI